MLREADRYGSFPVREGAETEGGWRGGKEERKRTEGGRSSETREVLELALDSDL